MIAISRRWLIKIGKYNKGVKNKYCKNDDLTHYGLLCLLISKFNPVLTNVLQYGHS